MDTLIYTISVDRFHLEAASFPFILWLAVEVSGVKVVSESARNAFLLLLFWTSSLRAAMTKKTKWAVLHLRLALVLRQAVPDE